MKQSRFLLACAAIGLALSAQAVTVSRSGTPTGKTEIGSYGPGSVFAVTATITSVSGTGYDFLALAADTNAGNAAADLGSNFIKVSKGVYNQSGAFPSGLRVRVVANRTTSPIKSSVTGPTPSPSLSTRPGLTPELRSTSMARPMPR